MRIYIIGNDGITLCREASAAVNDGEIAVASSEELHAARLSGKRLLALWNALPGAKARGTVGGGTKTAGLARPVRHRRTDSRPVSGTCCSLSGWLLSWRIYSPLSCWLSACRPMFCRGAR